MSERVSPFAALTGAEKQIKWLEYQSIRLPYIEGGMETSLPDEATAASQLQPKEKKEPEKALPSQPAPVSPQLASRNAIPNAADFQKTRHSQYDAIIARMKQAELQRMAHISLCYKARSSLISFLHCMDGFLFSSTKVRAPSPRLASACGDRVRSSRMAEAMPCAPSCLM